jgi:hypothetical protein
LLHGKKLRVDQHTPFARQSTPQIFLSFLPFHGRKEETGSTYGTSVLDNVLSPWAGRMKRPLMVKYDPRDRSGARCGEAFQTEVPGAEKSAIAARMVPSIGLTASSPFFGEDGKTIKFISIRTDITAAKLSEVKLREANQSIALATDIAGSPEQSSGVRLRLFSGGNQQHRPGRGVVERASGSYPSFSLQPPFFRLRGRSASRWKGCRWQRPSLLAHIHILRQIQSKLAPCCTTWFCLSKSPHLLQFHALHQ